MKLPDELTLGEKYTPAMHVADQDEADVYLAACVEHNLRLCERDGVTRTQEEAEGIERVNIGYWSGYYDLETRTRVERLFRCVHPLFGPVALAKTLTTAEILSMGREMGEEMRQKHEF